ncbi:unnamed protein product [Caenorhabditis brenneri]
MSSEIYEKAFAKSDKTDAILLVDGKKLHVNKALLSYHSAYFKALFNSESDEKSMEEVEIKDVKYEDFATLLSFVHLNPLKPTVENAEKLLELSDRFQLPAAKRRLELFLIPSNMDESEKLRIGLKYQIHELIRIGLSSLKNSGQIENFIKGDQFNCLCDESKVRVLQAVFDVVERF